MCISLPEGLVVYSVKRHMEVLYAHYSSWKCTKITKHPHLFLFCVSPIWGQLLLPFILSVLDPLSFPITQILFSQPLYAMEIEHGSGAENGNPQETLQRDCLCIPLCFGWKCWEAIYAIGKWHQAGRGCKPQGKQDSVRAWCLRKTNSLETEFVSMKSSTRFYGPPTWLGEVPQETQGLHLGTGWMSSQCWGPAKQAKVLWECMNWDSFSVLGGNPALLPTAEGSAGEFGVFWHQFHENGLIRESPVRSGRNNPRSWS